MTHFNPIQSINPLVIGIGELLWDLLPSGPRMGGAPANFACHARALGADSQIVSRVGNDEPGARLIADLTKLGLPVSGVSVDPSHPTGSVAVELLADGQPVFTIQKDVAWDHLVADTFLESIFGRADAVCFGTLAQRSPASAQAIRGLLALTPSKSLRVFDVNLRQDYFSAAAVEASLEMANVLKMSDAELPVIAKMFGLGGSPREVIAPLVLRFGLRLVAYTCGAEGSILFDGKEWCQHDGLAVNVSDTIGAGDSFTAVVTMGLLNHWPIDRISETANEVAAFVCSSSGAVPSFPDALRTRWLTGAPPAMAGAI